MDSSVVRDLGKVFLCQRTNKQLPLAEPVCVDPKAYCKARTACPIHLMEKEFNRLNK